MLLAGSYRCHATTDATTDVLRNGSDKHTSTAATCATYPYGSHKFNRPHWTFLQRKRDGARTTWSWWVPTTWGTRYFSHHNLISLTPHLLYSSSGTNSDTVYVTLTA